MVFGDHMQPITVGLTANDILTALKWRVGKSFRPNDSESLISGTVIFASFDLASFMAEFFLAVLLEIQHEHGDRKEMEIKINATVFVIFFILICLASTGYYLRDRPLKVGGRKVDLMPAGNEGYRNLEHLRSSLHTFRFVQSKYFNTFNSTPFHYISFR